MTISERKWMSQEEGQLSLAGRRVDKATDPVLINKVATAGPRLSPQHDDHRCKSAAAI